MNLHRYHTSSLPQPSNILQEQQGYRVGTADQSTQTPMVQYPIQTGPNPFYDLGWTYENQQQQQFLLGQQYSDPAPPVNTWHKERRRRGKRVCGHCRKRGHMSQECSRIPCQHGCPERHFTFSFPVEHDLLQQERHEQYQTIYKPRRVQRRERLRAIAAATQARRDFEKDVSNRVDNNQPSPVYSYPPPRWPEQKW